MRNNRTPETTPKGVSKRTWADLTAIAYAANAMPIMASTSARFAAICLEQEQTRNRTDTTN